MKKVFLILILGIFLLQSVFAIDLNVEKISDGESIVLGLESPAIFTLNVTNNGPNDKFLFYTFFGMGIEPSEAIEIKSGESKIVELKVFPRLDSTLSGHVIFPYFIQGKDRSEIEKSLIVNMVPLKDAFEIGANSIDPESNSVNIYVHNKLNFEFENLVATFDSPFFNFERKFNLKSYERKNFEVTLERSEFAKLMAGFYTLKIDFAIKNISGSVEETIDFVEKDIVKNEENQFGIIISTDIIKKTNDGNTINSAQITVKKNILSRMFTSFSPQPMVVKREGFGITYFWDEKLNPGESFEVKVQTNWLLPFLIIILIIATVIFARKYSKTDLVLRKRISFVNAKGGEFALKVMISVEARRFVEKVKIFDRLPPLVKIYEKFGGDLPKRFNRTKKVFEWEFDSLQPGERRFLSYVIYSKVGILGKFALPETFATLQREGKIKEVSSNKAYFLSEQKKE
ncbi:hypothetical protein COU58_04120 [Candidatus Pacearchaeota archaeon CG10_big_fil_rev_8_21_14_0_10_32_42]|nr:MAG: hypothetical protein COU58_04120 [Candidatus Pacearchaeota archaeon CG10_big_fil_rev_8_21_14_0_10_32_42]